ncbi:TolC family protein [Granulicella sibirica]|uniref:Heavy metal RND efflux outer membrane protein, CzcC family n=1 Tax=Granulicella sibirica TaxID=2479048 RepID=A0A4Q0T251_9BACT|nr:TolC family protein [Granulicella sibirica]RXH55989.1 Heavy metal RND efflux outer membrane protein, CzcC family [Granulicella sibirica]
MGLRASFMLTVVMVAGTASFGQQGMTMPMDHAAMKPENGLPALAPANDLLGEIAKRPALSLDDFLSRAKASNPTLDQARADVRRTQGLAVQAGLFPNPTIGYQGDQIRGGSFGGGEQGAFVGQMIPLGGKLSMRRKALEAEAQVGSIGIEVQAARVRADVTQAFFATLAAQETVQVRRRLLGVAQDAVETAHQLANVGQADAPDVLMTEVEEEQAVIASAEAQRMFLGRFRSLAALAGSPQMEAEPLTGDLAAVPAIEAGALLDHVLQENPAVMEAQSKVAAAEARLASARREVAPDLQLKAGEQFNFEQLNNTTAGKVGPQSFASAGISVPLWNRNQGNIEAAQAEAERARQEVRRIQLALRESAEPMIESYQTARQEAGLYRSSILPRATRASQLYEAKYNEMAQAYPQVLVARRTVLELQLRYIGALAAMWQIGSSLENGTLSGGLNGPRTFGGGVAGAYGEGGLE